MGRIYRISLVALGCLAVGLGVLGIFLPLLPTTPFLLLAAMCFSRSSRKLHDWLLGHPWFGVYIRSYREVRAIPFRAKVAALALMWPAIGYVLLAFDLHWLIKAALGLIAIAVTVHIVRLKNLTRRMADELYPGN